MAIGVTQAQYEQVLHQVMPNDQRPVGLRAHVAGPSANGWCVVELWDSQAALDRFVAEKLGQALHDAGITGQPTTFEWSTPSRHEPRREHAKAARRQFPAAFSLFVRHGGRVDAKLAERRPEPTVRMPTPPDGGILARFQPVCATFAGDMTRRLRWPACALRPPRRCCRLWRTRRDVRDTTRTTGQRGRPGHRPISR